MGYNASVRCTCWERGLTKLCPYPVEYVRLFDEIDMPELYLPGGTPTEDAIAFDRWVFDCCAHEDMELVSVHIGNIATMGHFRHALHSATGEKLQALRDALPETNSGRSEPGMAALCLKSLDAFQASPEYLGDPAGYDYSCDALRQVFTASVQTGRPVVWS